MKRQKRKFVSQSRSGGAVIIVVVSLLTTLVFLGLFFYNWTNQERTNAEYYADATARLEFDPEPIADFGLRQVLVSTDESLTNSALFGSRWSLAAHIVGPLSPDGEPLLAHPYSGTGIIPQPNPIDPRQFTLDYTGDGNADRDETTFILNFSPLSNGGSVPNLDFNPAAGYTYPDVNSLFLALDYTDPTTSLRVVKPSFALPGYFPALREGGFGPWYTAPQTRNQVLRPHREIRYSNDNSQRYLIQAQQALSGDRNRTIEPFPFTVSNATAGVWDGSGETYSVFDMDLTGDGVLDSLAIDLDHPLIDLPGGRQVVPIFYYKVIDQDALLNTNVHGHMPQFALFSRAGQASLFDNVADRNTWVHYSNLGITPSEINPLFALSADPNSDGFLSQTDVGLRDWATLPHRGMLADRTQGSPVPRAAANDFNRLNMANMELAMLLLGRPEFDSQTLEFVSSNDWVGRYGRDDEATGVSQLRLGLSAEGADPPAGQFPAPGRVNFDDDRDSNQHAQRRSGGMRRVAPRLSGLTVPPFVHPLDFVGLGNSLDPDGSTLYRMAGDHAIGERIAANVEGMPGEGGMSNNPVRWLQYPQNGPWQDQGQAGVGGNTAFRTYRDAIVAGGNLLQPLSLDLLIDEADEMIVNWNVPDRRDAPFTPSEIAALHLSESDWRNARMSSRLRNLAPFNFEYNRRAAAIRSQFTTETWDRMQFALGPVASDTFRQWEFNDGATNRFPPRFPGAGGTSRHERTDPNDPGSYDQFIVLNDPFRPEVRRLLTTRLTGSTNAEPLLPQRRLNLNRILSDDVLAANNNPDAAAFDEAGNPHFRDLVPHAVPHAIVELTAGSVPDIFHENVTETFAQTLDPDHPYNRFADVATDPVVQEWWARYDRQRLARDIYVLLYTLSGYSGGNPDATDVTMTPVDSDIAREMAQFAVNYVDALDRDSVITKFEYDPDLSTGGWNPTEVVYGVEGQQLAFSEVLLIETAATEDDNPHTLHDDREYHHRFLYIKLRNLSPFEVELGNQSWRLARMAPNSNDVVIAARFQSPGAQQPKTIPAGGNYIIGCHDGLVRNGAGQAIGSEFYVNFGEGEGDELQCVVPKGAPTIADNQQVPEQQLDFDLTAPEDGLSDDADFVIFENADPEYPGTTLVEWTPEDADEESGAAQLFDLVLQRRRSPGVDDGPEWIEVDRIRVDSQGLRFDADDADPPALALQLEQFASTQRLYPLMPSPSYPDEPRRHPMNDDEFPLPYHSMNIDPEFKDQANAELIRRFNEGNLPRINAPNDIRLWQPHFDRDFSSAMELLSIPVYGPPSSLTPVAFDQPNEAVRHGGVPFNLVQDWRLTGHRTAQSRFLLAGGGASLIDLDPNGVHPWNDSEIRDEIRPNRWFRLFNFVEVPPRNQDVIAERLHWHRRTPGRMNLNTLRHEHVFAGLIDDSVHHDYTNPTYDDNRPTRDTDGNRWWIRQFLRARDPDQFAASDIDPDRPRLPGTPDSRPFRSPGYIDPVNPEISVANTILRFGISGVGDSGALERAGLFEARPVNDFDGNNSNFNERVDYHTRHRLLEKVANNTTTRSHVFAIWAGFTLHEAHRLPNGNVQIGARADDLPAYRQFLVVDMSRLEEAHDPNTNAFDFRKFIIHRQQLP